MHRFTFCNILQNCQPISPLGELQLQKCTSLVNCQLFTCQFWATSFDAIYAVHKGTTKRVGLVYRGFSYFLLPPFATTFSGCTYCSSAIQIARSLACHRCAKSPGKGRLPADRHVGRSRCLGLEGHICWALEMGQPSCAAVTQYSKSSNAASERTRPPELRHS